MRVGSCLVVERENGRWIEKRRKEGRRGGGGREGEREEEGGGGGGGGGGEEEKVEMGKRGETSCFRHRVRYTSSCVTSCEVH